MRAQNWNARVPLHTLWTKEPRDWDDIVNDDDDDTVWIECVFPALAADWLIDIFRC